MLTLVVTMLPACQKTFSLDSELPPIETPGQADVPSLMKTWEIGWNAKRVDILAEVYDQRFGDWKWVKRNLRKRVSKVTVDVEDYAIIEDEGFAIVYFGGDWNLRALVSVIEIDGKWKMQYYTVIK